MNEQELYLPKEERVKRFLVLVFVTASTMTACRWDRNVDILTDYDGDSPAGGGMTDASDTDADIKNNAVISGDASTLDADLACNGGPIYTHQANLNITVPHTDFFWKDCVPLNTHNAEQAAKACNAVCVAISCQCDMGSICDGGTMIVAQVGTETFGWSWSSPDTGEVWELSSNECSFYANWN